MKAATAAPSRAPLRFLLLAFGCIHSGMSQPAPPSFQPAFCCLFLVVLRCLAATRLNCADAAAFWHRRFLSGFRADLERLKVEGSFWPPAASFLQGLGRRSSREPTWDQQSSFVGLCWPCPETWRRLPRQRASATQTGSAGERSCAVDLPGKEPLRGGWGGGGSGGPENLGGAP